MLMRPEECQRWEKKSHEKKIIGGIEGKKTKITVRSRRKKMRAKGMMKKKIAASEESRHLLSALHLSTEK